ncbi:MAG: UDP-N-acetylmuramate--L-alanine ligase [Sphingobacteriia bacterium]|nr:UDP-N-acetylmuramate--L-alanine ligase [Sphingobacteriia bacterium]
MSRNIITSRFGVIHFVGIGGIGMSGIAEILHNLGCKVQGSDVALTSQVKHLQDMGIKVVIGHEEENIEDASVIVRSSAVKMDNPEIIAGRKKRIPIIQRAEMLAELMRFKFSIGVAGTHGKTTTTSLVASVFEAEGLEPTVINGGVINSKLTNAYLGESEYLIAEADESDGSFTKLPVSIVIITNMNEDHMEHYGTFDNLKAAYKQFVENIPFYGFAVLCNDHEEVAKLAQEVIDRKIITYGIDKKADVMATNIRSEVNGSYYDIVISDKVKSKIKIIKDCFIPVPGRHNILNSLAALTIGIELGFTQEGLKNGFKSFKGVKRRFTLTGEVEGIKVIDDYAHHPTEIKATIQTAVQVVKKAGGKIIVVFQPHRYTRLHNLFADFTKAFDDIDNLIVADIYSAGEKPIEGVSKEVLIEAIRQHNSNLSIKSFENPEQLAELVGSIAKKGDLVLCLGAGNITAWANALPAQLINYFKSNNIVLS